MKDHMDGVLIKEFLGLREKMDSVLTDEIVKAKKTDNIKMAKEKGLKKNLVKYDVQHQHFKDCLLKKQISCTL